MDEQAVKEQLVEAAQTIATVLSRLPLDERIDALNAVRAVLHEASPFRDEPVDLVQWVWAGRVHANAYNPNSVAAEEMELLRISIREDGFTQPIVACPDGDGYEVIDGYHRSLTGRKPPLSARLHGYLPVTLRPGTLAERMAATVRHNRARGKHRVQSMAELVGSLEAQGVDRAAIAGALGMEAEEMLRLTRVGGVAAALAGMEYSGAWEAEDAG